MWGGGDSIAEALASGLGRVVGVDVGTVAKSPVDPQANTLEFINHYGPTIDGVRFDWEAYPHLVPVYEDDHDDLILMAGAQTGKSVRVMAGIARDALIHYGLGFGYFFPDFHLPDKFSSQRFAPFLRSSPELGDLLGGERLILPGGESKPPAGQDAVRTRNLGKSTIYFLSVAGKTSTEGLPMVGVYLDEVRRMSPGDIQRAKERQSAQRRTRNIACSTAYYPESDIHAEFLRGDQRYFHTACGCPDGVVLSLTFPDCLADLTGCTPQLRRQVEHAFSSRGLPYLGLSPEEIHKWGEAVYLCPQCGTVIVDPRDGYWEPHNPGAYAHSYQMPQLLSPTFPASRCLQKYQPTTGVIDLQEVWNSMVGLPWIDREKQPVHPEHLLASVNPDLHWPANMSVAWRAANLRNTVMGIDAMGGYCCLVIKERAPNGKARTIHVEVTHGDDPWKRCAHLMQEYNVRVCVADCNPHWNEAHRFARAFKGRVWLCTYDSSPNPQATVVDWKDRGRRKGEEMAKEASFKYMVRVHRTKGLKWSLGRWKRGLNETPDPDALIQSLPVSKGRVVLTPGLKVGEWRPVPICRTLYWLHQQRVAFARREVTEQKRRMGIVEEVAEHVGIDPHLAHSDLYANVALARLGKPGKSELL